jgi:phage tail sheath protein FI
MPVQVSYPGVYIEEIPSGVHTITGVSTSIAAFFGRATKGPTDKAVRILSLSDYVRTFGAPHPSSDLANDVRLFFANGGTDAYVVRLARDAQSAKITLRTLAAQDVLNVTAKAKGVWANTVRLEVDYNTSAPDETFNLKVIQEEKGAPVVTENFPNLTMNPTSARFAPDFVNQSSALINLAVSAAPMGDPKLSNSFYNAVNVTGDPANSFGGFSLGRRPLGANAAAVRTTLDGFLNPVAPAALKSQFDIYVNDVGPATVDLKPNWPATPGPPAPIQTNIENHITDRINQALSSLSPVFKVEAKLVNVAGIGFLLQLQFEGANTGGDKASIRVRRAATADISAALMLGVEQGGVEPVRWSNFRPAPNASVQLYAAPAAPGTLTNLNNLAALAQNAIVSIQIDATTIPVNLVTGVPPNPADLWVASKPDPNTVNNNSDGVREKLGIIAAAINGTAGLKYTAQVWGYHLAILSKDSSPNAIPTAISTGNADFDPPITALNIRQYTLGDTAAHAFTSGGVPGDDGKAPDINTYLGDPTTQTGFYALDPIDLFNLMALAPDDEVPPATFLDLWGPASNYCASRRAFLLVDAPANWSGNGQTVVAYNTSLVTDLRTRGVDKKNSAIFYPRLRMNAGGLVKSIAPAGAIAGLMARIDTERGVWKAPAGTEADIRAVVGLEVSLTDAQNGVLNKLAVNCLRSFPSGIVNWGARTNFGSDDDGSEWKYIPIRRFALFLEESLFRGTKWIVFEPNDEPLWAKIRLNINAFMTSLFRQGAFQGSTPDKAFYVKCDSETTTQNDRNLGIVNIEVGFAPLKPAEFVIIKIQQIAGEL